MRAVLFDLDDTLISEKEYVKSGYRAAAEAISPYIGESGESIYDGLWALFAESPQYVFNRFLENRGIAFQKEDILSLIRVYREHVPVIRFHGDVLETLSGLREKGCFLGIISDGYAVTQRRKADALHAGDYFDKIILTDTLGKEYWKPSPKAFDMMREASGVPLDETVYVGDNPEKDFYISTIRPVKTARIYRQDGVYREREYREGVKETYSLHDLRELLTL